MNQTKKPPTWKQTIAALWNYLYQDKKRFVGAIAITFIKTSISIMLTVTIGLLIQNTFLHLSDPNPEVVNAAWKQLIYGCLIVLSGYFVFFTLYLWAAKIIIKISFGLGYRIRDLIFMKLHRLPYREIQQKMSGDLMAKATIDVNALAVNMSISASNMFAAPVIVLGVYITLFILSPYLALIMVAMFIIVVGGAAFFAKNSSPCFKKMQDEIGEMNVEVEEKISNRKIIKLFNLHQTMHDRFKQINNQQRQTTTVAETKVNYIFPWNEFIENCMLSVLYVVAILLAINHVPNVSFVFKEMTVGVLTSFVLLARQANGEAIWSLRLIGFVQKMLVAGNRSLSILSLPNYVDNGQKQLTNIEGDIRFNNVSFGYVDNHMVLDDLSFHIPKKTTTAIVGPTGSGKTTIINLLLRFYEINMGTITIDGHNIKEVSQQSLCDNIAVVLQETFLFSDSIKNNILYGNHNASYEEMVAAAKSANIHDFIQSLPDKYETVISERINDFSNGQIQMIALARAFLSKAPILILDEATACVDTKTEKDIQDAILRLMQERTVLVIAHRLSTIVDADQIIVLRAGKLVEHGSHEQLLAQNGFYADLYKANAIMNE